MKEHPSDQLRNVALAGHTSSGKSTLAEALLFSAKAIDRLGRVDDGNTTSDYDPEEIRRKISINATLLPFETKTHKINLLDLPGSRDFVGEIKNCMRMAETVLFVVDAGAPFEGGLEFAWSLAEEFGLPRAVFINKMDKERASFERALETLRAELNARLIPVTLPIGSEASFSGVADLLRMKACSGFAGQATLGDIPAELDEEAKAARAALTEIAAEGDDALLEKFLADEPLTADEIVQGLRETVAENRAVPVLCGSATTGVGVEPLTHFIASTLPSPLEGRGIELADGEQRAISPEGPLSAFVFKTVSDDYAGRLTFFKIITGALGSDAQAANPGKDKTERLSHVLSVCGKKASNAPPLSAGDIGAVSKLAVTETGDTLCDPSRRVMYAPTALPKPVCSMAIAAKSKADEEKVGMGLHRLIEQDPTLAIRRDSETAQTILTGMGETHLDVAVSRLRSHAKMEVELALPKVPYRETLTRKAEGQGKYKKQSGGRGQYGDCHVRLEPQERGAGFSFEWQVVGGVIPTKYAPAVEKGLAEALDRGVLAGYPTVDVKAACYDGTYHTVDSSEMAFKVAASMAFKNVAPKAGPVILEPIMNLTIETPESYTGDVMGDLNSRRGRILGMELVNKRQMIRAQAPQAELFTYSRDLRSITHGRGSFELEFSHYEAAPAEVQQKIIEGAEKTREAETA